jgi:hypothetical protein
MARPLLAPAATAGEFLVEQTGADGPVGGADMQFRDVSGRVRVVELGAHGGPQLVPYLRGLGDPSPLVAMPFSGDLHNEGPVSASLTLRVTQHFVTLEIKVAEVDLQLAYATVRPKASVGHRRGLARCCAWSQGGYNGARPCALYAANGRLDGERADRPTMYPAHERRLGGCGYVRMVWTSASH